MNEKYERLTALIRGMGRVAVAYSGGIDSTLVLKVAHDALGDNAVGLTAVSASMPHYEQDGAAQVAAEIGARVIWVNTHEDEDENYLANPTNRCYFCKTNVYDELLGVAAREGFPVLLDGANADDVGDWRPGRQAAKEHGVRSPLEEAGMSKADIRGLARELGLSNWDMPSAPCLSSRVPYGTRISPETLDQIGKGEWALRERGFREVRVRHHGDVARIEVPPAEFAKLLELREEIVADLKKAGYTFVSLDLSGLKSGSLNQVIPLGRREATPTAE